MDPEKLDKMQEWKGLTMVELVKNLQIEDSNPPLNERSSLEEGDTVPDNLSDVANFEEPEVTEVQVEKDSEGLIEESHLPPSKWSSLARAFRLGLSVDSQPQNNGSKEVKSMQQEMKPTDKRGSLGKMFRYGQHARPGSSREHSRSGDRSKSDFEMKDSNPGTLQHTERGMKWNIFKHGKSHSEVPSSRNGDGTEHQKDDDKKRPLSRLLHIRSRAPKGDQEGQATSLPSPEARGRSLGKFFRQNKNPPAIKTLMADADKIENEKEGNIELQENQ